MSEQARACSPRSVVEALTQQLQLVDDWSDLIAPTVDLCVRASL